jgi:CDP-diacylglycerol--inositol 3-phosphatidyltransferase
MPSTVYFFWPNLIGYARILLACAAFYMCFSNPYLFYSFYAVSQLLDAVDGNVARAFGQETRYGAVLDMVTDRCSTAALLTVLSYFYPNYILIFAFLIALDISSHYAHLYSSLLHGKTSHKKVDEKQSRLLRLYYGNRYVLFALCFGNEATLLTLYLLHFTSGPLTPLVLGDHHFGLAEVFLLCNVPLLLIKQIMNVVQLIQAGRDIAHFDEKERSTMKSNHANAAHPPSSPSSAAVKSPRSPRARPTKKKSQ